MVILTIHIECHVNIPLCGILGGPQLMNVHVRINMALPDTQKTFQTNITQKLIKTMLG